jgi:surface protein
MSRMFMSADAFNGDISTWDTSSVTDTSSMFTFASAFEGRNGLSNWDTSSINDMSEMYFGAFSFKGNGLASWNVKRVVNMRLMVSELLSLVKEMVRFERL